VQDLSTIANVATALTVITGVIFALWEARRARLDREERAAFATVQAIFSSAWIGSANHIQAMRHDMTAEEIENDPRILRAAQALSVILEGLGYSVYARIIPFHVVDDLLGGVVRVAWRNLRVHVEYQRAQSGSDKNWEWFQWLAEQVERNGSGKTDLRIGAHRAFADWKP
jgi:hypothetical protein